MTERRRRPRPPDTEAPTPAQVVRESHDDVILLALLGGATIAAAAALAGVHDGTVNNRLADPSFRARLELLREDATRAVMDKIRDEAMASVEVLAKIRDNPKATWSSRVRAADRILVLALGTPQVEITQNNVTVSAGGQKPADALAAFLAKVAARDEAVPALAPPPPIDTTATEGRPEP